MKDTLVELHIHENAMTEEAFLDSYIDTLSELPLLKYLNIAKNGQLSS